MIHVVTPPSVCSFEVTDELSVPPPPLLSYPAPVLPLTLVASFVSLGTPHSILRSICDAADEGRPTLQGLGLAWLSSWSQLSSWICILSLDVCACVCALLTLSKDMVFIEYSQGSSCRSLRMRGINKGQTIPLLSPSPSRSL
jgi:hypothetical protein